MTAMDLGVRSVRARAWFNLSMNSALLASPVRESCSAWWAASSAARVRSST